jgi:hypothetical protein
VDEAHYGKRLYKKKKKDKIPTLRELNKGKISGSTSPYTLRTFGFVRLCQAAPHAFLLSGTLMENTLSCCLVRSWKTAEKMR